MDDNAIKSQGSPEWWLNHLLLKFNARDTTYDLQGLLIDGNNDWRQPTYFRTRKERLNLLWSYYIGRPPLPRAGEKARETFRDVLRTARANYAAKAIQPIVDRMDLLAVRTGMTEGVEGDEVAKRIMEYSNFAASLKDGLAYTFSMSESYLMVIPAAENSVDRTPLITAEDPRFCIGEQDPENPNQLLAALKLGYDVVQGKVMARLFFDGRKYTASCAGTDTWAVASYGARSFEWEGEPVALPQLAAVDAKVPIIQLPNARNMGEFEPHIDVLDRINDGIMNRLKIVAYQGAKQRAIIGDLEDESDNDEDQPVEPIDWDEVFDAAPDALWRVPEGTSFWESNPSDISGILAAVRDDVKEFAAMTDTPLHLITPDAANQSAEGASLMREGLVFKVKDRRARMNPRLVLLFKMAFAFAGEAKRAKNIELLWGPVESFSLTEKSNAVAQTKGVLSRRRQLQDVMEMTPDQIEQNEQELQQDRIFDAAFAPAGPGAAPAPPPLSPPAAAPAPAPDAPAAVSAP
ncbi:phage portal protein [Mycobacterium sp. TY813]|uniref:phage portal protein n=1 Tax=Mycobacterium TaxID=1763 RepID=UPI002741DEEE|nr:phage portal protein [Mycobacterium sp. TY813]MDP7729504.1 phage portal protein [Mycobacterium sp. TY813]